MTGKKYLNIVVHNLIMLSVVCSCSTKIERPDSYNYNRGCEALQNEEREEAMKYFEKEVENNPENGYAWGYIMQLHSRDTEYGKAISAGEKALKYINKKDTEWRAYVHAGIGAAYLNMDQTDKAIAEISEAIKDEPEDIDYLERRADIFVNLKEYELADKDYERILSIDKASCLGTMGLARNRFEQKRYDEAIELFTQAIKLDDSFSQPYAFRADCYLAKGSNHKAAQDFQTFPRAYPCTHRTSLSCVRA